MISARKPAADQTSSRQGAPSLSPQSRAASDGRPAIRARLVFDSSRNPARTPVVHGDARDAVVAHFATSAAEYEQAQ